MNCDVCHRPMPYAFYINDEHWRRVVGEDKFSKSVGRVCAHCTLEKLGGASWCIVWNDQPGLRILLKTKAEGKHDSCEPKPQTATPVTTEEK